MVIEILGLIFPGGLTLYESWKDLIFLATEQSHLYQFRSVVSDRLKTIEMFKIKKFRLFDWDFYCSSVISVSVWCSLLSLGSISVSEQFAEY